MRRSFLRPASLALTAALLLTVGGVAEAQNHRRAGNHTGGAKSLIDAPEIDPALLTGALILVAGGALLLIDRARGQRA